MRRFVVSMAVRYDEAAKPVPVITEPVFGRLDIVVLVPPAGLVTDAMDVKICGFALDEKAAPLTNVMPAAAVLKALESVTRPDAVE